MEMHVEQVEWKKAMCFQIYWRLDGSIKFEARSAYKIVQRRCHYYNSHKEAQTFGNGAIDVDKGAHQIIVLEIDLASDELTLSVWMELFFLEEKVESSGVGKEERSPWWLQGLKLAELKEV